MDFSMFMRLDWLVVVAIVAMVDGADDGGCEWFV